MHPGHGPTLRRRKATGGAVTAPHVTHMNLRNLKEVETAVVGMIFLMRRAVTTRDDGAYVYPSRTGFALRPRPGRAGAATG